MRRKAGNTNAQVDHSGVCGAPRAGLEPATLRLRLSPLLSHRSGLSHHPGRRCKTIPPEGCRALSGLIAESTHPLVSARSPLRDPLFAGLRSGSPCHKERDVGFPEFTRCFNPGYPGKLLFLREALCGNLHTTTCICQFLPEPSASSGYIPSPTHRIPWCFRRHDEAPELPDNDRTHNAGTCRLCR